MEGTNQNLTKILIKVMDENNASKWIHLCYIPEALYEQYKTLRQQDATNLNQTIARWIKEDFGKEMEISVAADLATVKELVKEYYKETYPDVYLEQSTDRQGWLRVWIVKKMKEDLEINGE